MKKIYLILALAAFAFAGCQKDFIYDGPIDPADLNANFTVDVEIPGTYTAAGVTAALPASMLKVLDMTKEEFASALGSSVKVGYTTETAAPYDAAKATWGAAQWYNASGVASSTEKVVSIVNNKDYTSTVNVDESLCGLGNTYVVTQAFQRTLTDGSVRTCFVKYNVKAVKLYDLAQASTSFSMSTGVVSAVKLAVKKDGRTYRPARIELPETLYATLKAIQGSYDNLAYFIASGQIKCYAFPKASAIGPETKDAWFDKTGAVSDAANGGLRVTLDLEAGNPIQGGGRNVYVVLEENAAKLAAGDKFNCGFIFVYGTYKIPLILSVTVVDEL